jgi:hypothetical protein
MYPVSQKTMESTGRVSRYENVSNIGKNITQNYKSNFTTHTSRFTVLASSAANPIVSPSPSEHVTPVMTASAKKGEKHGPGSERDTSEKQQPAYVPYVHL